MNKYSLTRKSKEVRKKKPKQQTISNQHTLFLDTSQYRRSQLPNKKRHRLTDGFEQESSPFCCIQEII